MSDSMVSFVVILKVHVADGILVDVLKRESTAGVSEEG